MPLRCALVAAGLLCAPQSTPMGELELAVALRDAHGAVFASSPSVRRLAIAWAQAALECGRGAHAVNWNFGNVGASSAQAHHTIAGQRFASYNDAVEGAQGYWLAVRAVCSGALRAFDDGDPEGAAERLSRCGYHRSDVATYGAAMSSLYGHALRSVLPKL